MKPFTYDRTWTFALAPDELWSVLTRTDEYPLWWRWLRGFDTAGLIEGEYADCVVRGPLPYSLTFRIHILEVVPSELVRTEVSGDLDGPARLELTPKGADCNARLSWSVDLRSPLLRPMARWARPLMEWGHNWVVDNGVARFRDHALVGRPT
jgi:uncharacterized protein YndB with AHSA1/START domain